MPAFRTVMRFAGLGPSAPDRIRTSDLWFRRPRRLFVGARPGSEFGSTTGLEFVWVRLDFVPSVALLLPTALPSRISLGRAHQPGFTFPSEPRFERAALHRQQRPYRESAPDLKRMILGGQFAGLVALLAFRSIRHAGR